MDVAKKVVVICLLFGAGLGMGFMASLVFMLKDEPPVIYEEKWRTFQAPPTQCPDLSHTSLNEDELKTLLTIMETTTTTTKPPPTTVTTAKVTTTTTVAPSTTSTVPVPATTTSTTLLPS